MTTPSERLSELVTYKSKIKDKIDKLIDTLTTDELYVLEDKVTEELDWRLSRKP
tara:strand:+ start:710 stop:871 length:162 start_codon:yes stop_codon:yes gene_type:complete